MASLSSLRTTLNRIDWDFPGAGNYGLSIHSVHWFPGNFIAQIPSAFVQVLSEPGQLVLDPFGGSGTTAVEASRLGRRAISADRITACAHIAQAKLDLQSRGLSPQVIADLLDSITWEHLCHSDKFGEHGEGSQPDLARWYGPRTLSQLRYLWNQIERQPDSQRAIVALIFWEVLFVCASPGVATTASGKRRRHHWGWIADNVRPTHLIEHAAVKEFRSRLIQVAELSGQATGLLATSLNADARCLPISSNSVDLVVTSPPYVGVIDYTRANRLLYLWMNWPFDSDRAAEIGARFKRGRNEGVADYLAQMRACWVELHRVMRRGAHCAIVIGESRRFPGTVEKALADLGELMPALWGPIPRNPSRRRVSERRAREAVEYLEVFRKA
jgi:DNA methylase